MSCACAFAGGHIESRARTTSLLYRLRTSAGTGAERQTPALPRPLKEKTPMIHSYRLPHTPRGATEDPDATTWSSMP